MIDKSGMIRFDEIFPQTKGIKVKGRGEAIKLARKVAAALKKESENLVKEQQNSPTSGFFSPSA